jgi:hypothetical protein
VRRVSLHQPFQKPELHRERHEPLLRAVVEVPLELPALFVLRGDQPLARRAELLDRVQQVLGEPRVPHHEPGLRGQVADQLLLGRRERLPRPFLDRQRAEQLATVTDRLEHR